MIETRCLRGRASNRNSIFSFYLFFKTGVFSKQITTFSTVAVVVYGPSKMTFSNLLLPLDSARLFLVFNHMPSALLAATNFRLLP